MIRNLITALVAVWALAVFVNSGSAYYRDNYSPCRQERIQQNYRRHRPPFVVYDGRRYHNPQSPPISVLPSITWLDITAPDDYNPMELMKRQKLGPMGDTFIKFGKVRKYP